MAEHLVFVELFQMGSIEWLMMAFTVRLTGYQPQYFPRLHYFARILDSDIFTVSDYLQYVRKHAYPNPDGTTRRGPSYQAHTPIKTAQGVLLLDIPVRKGGVEGCQTMLEARIDYSAAWQQKNLNSIHHHYRNAPRYKDVFPSLSLVMTQRYDSLAECTTESVLWALGTLLELPCDRPKGPLLEDINVALRHFPFRLKRIVRMSETDIKPADKEERDANDWLIETCKAFSADEYHYGGTSARAYMDFSKFERAGIALKEQEWLCSPYRQLHGAFLSNLSIVDLLMNVSPAEARDVLHTKE